METEDKNSVIRTLNLLHERIEAETKPDIKAHLKILWDTLKAEFQIKSPGE
jgi:hypothetical protein